MKVETTDSIGDTEVRIYSWSLDSSGAVVFDTPFTPN